MRKTIIDLFEHSAQCYASNTFLLEKTGKKYLPTTYEQTKQEVYKIAAGFIALGVKRGENMALLSEGRNLWITSELAMFYAGATNVPLSIKLEESNDLLFRLNHAEVKYIVVSGNQLKKIRSINDKLEYTKKIIVLDNIDDQQSNEIMIDEIRKMGEHYLRGHSLKEFLSIGKSLKNEDYATITYTSGTTADPKGVILTHRNYTANIEQALTLVDIDETWRTLIILPLDHCFAHVVGFYIFMSVGATVATVQVGKTPMETLKNIPKNIKEVKPHMILSVPALAKNFKKSIEQGIKSKGKLPMYLFNFALKVSETYHGDGNYYGAYHRKLLKPFVSIFDKLFFSKIRHNFGGKLRFFIGGGALLDKDLQKFYCAIGMPMFQGYGLSEATPVISSNGPEKYIFGSSGKLVHPLEIMILDHDGREMPTGEKGEIVIRGENVMHGYWKNSDATAETIKNEWLYTGDLGYMGTDGMLYVLGRFKSLLIGSDGEKYSPEGIEEAMVEHCEFIDQVMLYNNQSAYTTALIVPNLDKLKHKLKHHKLSLASDEGRKEALSLIQGEIAKFKKGGIHEEWFPDRWLPATFAILPEPFTEQNLMINSTMKMVRNKIEAAYQERIDSMYTTEGKNIENQANIEALNW